MTETEILKLKKPAENDYYNVQDFNDNMDKLEAAAAEEKAKAVVLRIFADEQSEVAVMHSTGVHTGKATRHAGTDATSNGIYVEFDLPCGGDATFMCVVDGVTHKYDVNLVDGSLEVVMCLSSAVYQSVLAKVPAGFFNNNDTFGFTDDAGVVQLISKVSFEKFQSGYTATTDCKNELWHAVRCGMITAAQYKTITGEEYPEIPETRYEV